MRDAAGPETEASEQGLDQRGQEDAERDAADGLPGEAECSLARLAAETIRERERAAGCGFTAAVENREDHHGEQDEHEGAADAAGCRDGPGRRTSRVRLN